MKAERIRMYGVYINHAGNRVFMDQSEQTCDAVRDALRSVLPLNMIRTARMSDRVVVYADDGSIVVDIPPNDRGG